MKTSTRSSRFLTAALLGAALTFAPVALAGGCPGGSCGGPNAVEQAVAAVNVASSTVNSADLETAYDKLVDVHEKAEKLGVENTNTVAKGIQNLAKVLEQRASGELEAALKQYDEGKYEAAVTEYERIAKLEGLKAAKRASTELNIEPDRVSWRTLRDTARTQVAASDHLEARETLTDLQRLSRRTGYTTEQRELSAELSKVLMPRVDAAIASVESGQYDSAYTTLIEISRISTVRESSTAARKVLTQNTANPGMRQAKAEYEGKTRLSDIQGWLAEIAHPSSKELELYRTTLDQIANTYANTQAGAEAKRLLEEKSDAQARF